MNLGEKMTDEEVEEMIKMADCDKNGKIDVDGRSILIFIFVYISVLVG